MSAIFGIYSLDGKPVHPQLLEEMSDILSHRGTDDTGIWSDGFIGLGHRMLWTTPESINEKLPNSINNDDLVITADARIDNREELINQLGLNRGSSDETISDSEIILFSYRKWGEECTEKLIGDFAFAVWDKQNRSIFCARDHFGVKSLYYYYSENLFVFATEIKSLLSVPEVPCVLNEVRIGDFLTSVYDDVTSTFYKDIYRLPASYQMTVDKRGKKIKNYWSLDPERELHLSSDEEYAEKLSELFTEAVGCRMRSAYPIGSMLSGGIDSSSVACTARKIMLEGNGHYQYKESKLHTFSAIFENVPESDESFYINSVLRQGNFEPHFLKADQVSPLTDLEKMIWHQDEAVQTGNLYINWHLYDTAKSNGVRVILDGFDGDSTISHGTKYLLELSHSKQWVTLIREARGYAKNFEESATALIWAYYWRYGLEPKLSNRRVLKPLRRLGRKLYQRAMRKDKYAPLQASQFDIDLNPEFIKRIDLSGHHRTLKNARPGSPKTERADHYIQLLKGTTPFILEILDKTAAAFAVEVRYPFWDKRLVEFCLSLPANQKMHRGFTRMVMRRAMDGILPTEVQWRPGKSDLSHGFNNGLLNFEQSILSKTLNSSPHLLEKYINVASLSDVHERFSNGRATVADVLKISSSLSLVLWLQNAEFTD